MKKNLFIALVAITVIVVGGLTSCDVVAPEAVAPECVELQGLTASLKEANSQGGDAVNAWFLNTQNTSGMSTGISECGDNDIISAANEALHES